jgi:hypothetical protein
MLNRLKNVFGFFESHDVRYVVIGGIAAILHGVPRATFDLDILIEPTDENAQRLLDALQDAGLGTAALTTAREIIENTITVFEDKVRIDVQTDTPGIQFAEVWDRRERMEYDGQVLFVLRKEDVIASKLAAARPVDLEDVRLLRLDDESE